MTCKTCGKRFYPDKLKIHRKYFCGDDAVLTAAQALTARKGRAVKVSREARAGGAQGSGDLRL